jgi:hypothetical protein
MNGKFHLSGIASHRRIDAPGTVGAFVALGALACLASCKDPTTFDATKLGASSSDGGPMTQSVPPFNEDCPAGDDWIPASGGPPPPVRMFTPPPHPDTECPFYRGAYQNFLIATTPLADGTPAIVRYATLDDAFITSKPNHLIRNTGDPSADPYANPSGASGAITVRQNPTATGKAWLGAVRQAGQRNVLVDQNHHSLYYGIHMNQAFVDFIKANGLQTVNGILNVDPNLEFPAGLVEFKSAWTDIDPLDFRDKNGNLGTPNGIVPKPNDVYASDPGDYSNYITTNAWIPWLSQDPVTGEIKEDADHPVLRKMALVAIHCVYTFPGHPEFVWGSIQHVNINEIDPAAQAFAGVETLGAPDSQPNTLGPGGTPALPSLGDQGNTMVTVSPSMHNFLLFQGGTPENKANQALNEGIGPGFLTFEEKTQSFPNQQTSAYRVFPGAKSTTLAPDSAVFSLNSNINALFKSAIDSKLIDPNVDKRQHYRLVAAVWMDKPAFFGLGDKQADGTYPGMLLQNDDTSPLVIGAKQNPPNIYPNVSQGTFCGTPLDPTNTSGDSPRATGFNNTVPGCVTRADSLDLVDAGAIAPVTGPDGRFAPADPSKDFATVQAGTDSEFSILGGEDRLSSTAMETFTQTGQFNNCFTCHNTQPVTVNGTPASLASSVPVLIPRSAKLNVSHLFSEFVLRECGGPPNAACMGGDGGAGP